jgi:hypothetical protein
VARRFPRRKESATGPSPSSASKRMRDDDYDDLALPRRRPQREEHPTTMGMIGLILAGVSLGLLLVVLVLYFALKQEDQQQVIHQRTRLLYYWFGILDVLSFFIAVFAIVFSARGLAPSNPLYRGWALMGLMLSILEVVVTIFLGIFLGFAILCVEVMGNR